MPAAEISLIGGLEKGEGEHIAEYFIRPRTKDLISVRLSIDFGFGNNAEKRRGGFESRLTAVERAPGKFEATEYIGGYHITYADPSDQRMTRLSVVQRRMFKARVFNHNGHISYSGRDDVLTVTRTNASLKDGKYVIDSSVKTGQILIKQFETSEPNIDAHVALNAVTARVASRIETPLASFGFEPDGLILSDARSAEPLGLVIGLGPTINFFTHDVVFPPTHFAASLTIKNGETPGVFTFDKRVYIPKSVHERGGNTMHNVDVGGWPPVLPSFMDATK